MLLCMEVDATAYRQALDRLDYIRMTASALCALLSDRCDAAHSGIYVSAGERENAQAIIREAVSEMYYEAAADARQIKEWYERQQWRGYEREVRSE